jgi:hypothetical protein
LRGLRNPSGNFSAGRQNSLALFWAKVGADFRIESAGFESSCSGLANPMPDG